MDDLLTDESKESRLSVVPELFKRLKKGEESDARSLLKSRGRLDLIRICDNCDAWTSERVSSVLPQIASYEISQLLSMLSRKRRQLFRLLSNASTRVRRKKLARLNLKEIEEAACAAWHLFGGRDLLQPVGSLPLIIPKFIDTSAEFHFDEDAMLEIVTSIHELDNTCKHLVQRIDK